MQHLDEGVLQAWLDRPRSGMDDAEADRIEEHLAACDACATRLGELEGDTARMASIFGGAGPTEVEVPEFEAVLERAQGAGERDASVGDGSADRPSMRPWLSLGWAASLALAVGLGWISNEFYRSREAAPEAALVATDARAEPDPPRAEESSADLTELSARATDAAGVPAEPERQALGSPAQRTDSAAGLPRDAGSAESVWTPTTRAAAAAHLGAPPLFVPDLDVLEIAQGEIDGSPALRILQAIAPGIELTLVQRRAAIVEDEDTEPFADAAETDGTAEVSVRRGDLAVSGTAEIAEDSIRALLDGLR